MEGNIVMTFYKNLFIGDTVNNKDEIIRFINNNIPVFDVYFLCVDLKSKNNIMEILETKELFKYVNRKKNYVVIGIANGKKEAFKLSSDIIIKYIKDNKDLSNFKNDISKHI